MSSAAQDCRKKRQQNPLTVEELGIRELQPRARARIWRESVKAAK
jgi:hypothetical protein